MEAIQPSSLFAYCISNPIMYTDATGLAHHNLEVEGGDPKRDFAERHITQRLGVNDIYSYKFTYSAKKTISSGESNFSKNIATLASGVCKLANSIAATAIPVPKKLKEVLSKFKETSTVYQKTVNFATATIAQMFVKDPFESLWTKTAGSYESYHFSREKYSGIHASITTYELRVYDYSEASFDPSIDYEIWMSRLSPYNCIPESCIAKWSDPVMN